MSALDAAIKEKLLNPSRAQSGDISTIGVLLIIAGIIGIGIMLITHFFTVSHGSTGQVKIDNQMKSYSIGLGLFISIAFGGIILYEYFNTQRTKQFALMFGLTLFSLCLAYISFLSSLYQVKA